MNEQMMMESAASKVPLNLDAYQTDEFFDELFDAEGRPREMAKPLLDRLGTMPLDELRQRQAMAVRMFLNLGVTFNVYGDRGGSERIFPFDLVPRIVEAREWAWIERGLRQRIRALNMFIDDVYHDQRIVKDGVVPGELIRSSKSYLPALRGLNPPKGIWCHITGTDLVRDGEGRVCVLEDNLRVPSGVSYVLENRQALKRTFPSIFEAMRVRPVDDYPNRLLDMLQYVAPNAVGNPKVAVLTPGSHNSAYFEHSYLAQQMGKPLVEGRDLVVQDGRVMMRTIRGFEPVDVIYRRLDDAFLDPKAFRSDSLLGAKGLIEAYKAGRVSLVNAPGTGVADDKVIYAYVVKMIRYYLDEDAIIPNVPTFVCSNDKERAHVLANLDKLVVKAADESGGYGMLIGPHSTQAERDDFRGRIEADPRKYIAQPTLALSRAPVLVDGALEGRHVDLRPFILYGSDIWVLPGGLSRVALRKGSLVVNSSQGGGSKDTWVLSDPHGNAADAARN